MQNTELLSFLIRTLTVGMGISPIQQTLADFTADVEFHQPPKRGQRPLSISFKQKGMPEGIPFAIIKIIS